MRLDGLDPYSHSPRKLVWVGGVAHEECRLNLEAQWVIRAEENRDYCGCECTDSGRFNTLRVVEG
jgi:hypothetical protein